MARFFNIKNFRIGSTSYTTLETVTANDKFVRLMGKGDSDAVTTFQAKGSGDVAVTIKLQDPLQAEAIMNAAEGDITFNGITSPSSTTKLVTIKNFKAFERDETDAHDKINDITIRGHGYDPTGVGPVMSVA